MHPFFYIIIVNYRGANDTIVCLESLERAGSSRAQVIVVDNHSRDDSVTLISGWMAKKSWCELISSPVNEGFAHGNNQGLRRALELQKQSGRDLSSCWFWLLNFDTAVDRKIFAVLEGELPRLEKAGGVGTSVLYHSAPEQLQTLGGTVALRLANLRALLQRGKYMSAREHYCDIHARTLPVEGHVYGASFLIAGPVLREVGLLDEAFFLEYEEVDYSLRIKRAGYRLYVVGAARIWHKIGAAKSDARAATSEKYLLGIRSRRHVWSSCLIPLYYNVRNEVYFFGKHWPKQRMISMPLLFCFALLQIIGVFLYRDDHPIRRTHLILRAWWDGLLGNMGKSIDPGEFYRRYPD
jgi:hypothetical protein